MAHYAFLDENNVVTEVIVGIDESELIEGVTPEIWYGNFKGQTCKRTSINSWGGKRLNVETGYFSEPGAFRKNYAVIGGIYNEEKDAFISPKQYNSWIFDEEMCVWKAPVDQPDITNPWIWNEETLSWDEFPL